MKHEDVIDTWIVKALPQCADFGALVRALPGVYPAEVARALRRLGATLPMPKSELVQVPLGPTPHPADGDWRFDRVTCAALTEEVVQRCGAGGKGTLIGCPSLYLPTRARVTRVSLIEDNVAWHDWFQRRGVGIPLDGARCLWANDVIVADPPWYLPEYRYLLSLAGRLAKSHGTLLMAWPAEGTRPGLDEERSEMLGAAARCGWELVETRPLALGYTTPWYEAQALAAAGVPVLRDWRRGDLAVFERTEQEALDQLDRPPRPWTSARLGFAELRLRRAAALPGEADPRLVPIVAGDVLASVSRRDPAREHVRVWTAGNRVFGCARTDLLLELVAARTVGFRAACARIERILARGLDSSERGWCLEAWDHLVVLDEAERRDYHAAHDAAASTSLGTAS
jgi:hypothetical protein